MSNFLDKLKDIVVDRKLREAKAQAHRNKQNLPCAKEACAFAAKNGYGKIEIKNAQLSPDVVAALKQEGLNVQYFVLYGGPDVMIRGKYFRPEQVDDEDQVPGKEKVEISGWEPGNQKTLSLHMDVLNHPSDLAARLTVAANHSR